jgi:ERCC4-type nuclease
MTFQNIFSKTRKSKKIKVLPRIIADIHEKNSLVISELESSDQVLLEIKPLKIADYLIGQIAIERKTVNDFISSMLSKRLIQQLDNLQKYKQKLLIIEGIDEEEIYSEDRKLNPNSIRGFILSIILNHQIPIIFTQDYLDTSKYLILLAKQQSKPNQEISLHSRIPKTKREQKHYILESFPNIGPITAKNLIKKFKTISNTINATEEELERILKKKAKDFKKLLDS